jgi:DNA-binding transcriptional MocR family regulator
MEINLYAQLADSLTDQIREGLFKTGDKLPSVRRLAQREDVSISTVTTAYSMLEQRGWVEARPKSGYYVAQRQEDRLALPQQVRMRPRPRAATTSELVMEVQRDSARQKGVSMCAAIPALDFPILTNVQRTFTRLSRTRKYLGVGYDAPEGLPEFRQQIARRAVDAGVHVSPDEIVSTSGCQNAMALGLRVLTRPGDIIAVESPCYYGLIQMAEAYGLKVIEIPAHHDTGISIEAFELALEKWPIKALVSVATFSNPLGSVIPDERKEELVSLLEKYDVPMIEDDIYGELYFGERRPKSVKAFDRDGRIMLCSSVSKTIDPQLRVGWIMPGRYLDQVTHQKFIHLVSGSTLPQMVTAEIMAQGAYDRHLKQARDTYRRRSQHLVDLISQHFPESTRLSRPQGGLVAWVELPEAVNTTDLYHRGRAQNLTIAPGEMFSASGHYKNCFRINFAQGWSPERVRAVQTIGEWVRESL